MEINRKARRSGSAPTAKAKRTDAERAARGTAKKPGRAVDKPARQQDRLERRLREELDGSGANQRVRDAVARLLGQERTPAVERLLARVQTAQRVETVGPYGP